MTRFSEVKKGLRLTAVCLGVVTLLDANSVDAGERIAFEPQLPTFSDPNLFTGARVRASGHWQDQRPELAVDGRISLDSYWGCENLPVHLTVDMEKATEICAIGLWLYWGGDRVYRYSVEGSLNGADWLMLADRRDNRRRATPEGVLLKFRKRSLRFAKVTIAHSSTGKASGGHIVEVEGYGPRRSGGIQELVGTVGSVYDRYESDRRPQHWYLKTWSATAWRGERVNGQFAVWSDTTTTHARLSVTALADGKGNIIPETHVRPYFARYVLANQKPVPDIIDTASHISIPARTVRPIWLAVDVPSGSSPGVYKGQLNVQGNGGKDISFDLQLRVLDRVLPPPSEWKFHLDLWQSPWAVARYHHVKLWSDDHLKLMGPYLRMLASAGQKCLTASIVTKTWGFQTYDPLTSMIKWTKNADGSWTYDYTAFDRYVEFAGKCGLNRQINCDSMVPWGNTFYYHDTQTGDYVSVRLVPGTQEYEAFWRPFLNDFAVHLKEKGWFDRACIYFNERSLQDMTNAVRLLHDVAPDFKWALAGGRYDSLFQVLQDYSVFLGHKSKEVPRNIIAGRRKRGQTTTFYVCCAPGRPNTFTSSPRAESVWMGWYAAAEDYDGFLRWALNMWNRDPLRTTDYGDWPSGDTLLVYPGPRSSIRFELLREGIEDYAKIRILSAELRDKGEDGRQQLQELDEILRQFDYPNCGSDEHILDSVMRGRRLLTRLSR